jgi:hypothetical protein
MTSHGYLFDENSGLSLALIRRLLREREPMMTVQLPSCGEWDAPPIGSSDPELLVRAEEYQCMLVTERSCYDAGADLRDHLAANRHFPGVFRPSSIELSAMEVG